MKSENNNDENHTRVGESRASLKVANLSKDPGKHLRRSDYIYPLHQVRLATFVSPDTRKYAENSSSEVVYIQHSRSI